MAATYDCLVVRIAKNRLVNPVWSDSIRECATRYLTLLNNDCLVRDGNRMMHMRLLSGAISQADYDWWFDTHTIRGFVRRARRVLKRYLRRPG